MHRKNYDELFDEFGKFLIDLKITGNHIADLITMVKDRMPSEIGFHNYLEILQHNLEAAHDHIKKYKRRVIILDANYYLLISRNTDNFETPILDLYEFDTYSQLWQHLQNELFQNYVRWYQIYWGDTLMMQKLVR